MIEFMLFFFKENYKISSNSFAHRFKFLHTVSNCIFDSALNLTFALRNEIDKQFQQNTDYLLMLILTSLRID